MANYAVKQLKNSPSPKKRATDDWPRGSAQEKSGLDKQKRDALAAQDRAQQAKERELQEHKRRGMAAFSKMFFGAK